MSFVDITKDPYQDTLRFLIYGRQKVGKTTQALKLAENKHFVLMLSFDKGTFAVRRNPDKYKGYIAISYPNGIEEIRQTVSEASDKVKKLLDSGIQRGKIWVVVDTVSHMQTQLLTEARKVDIGQGNKAKIKDDFLREAVTRVDYLVNLGQMGEVMEAVYQIPANILLIALEKKEQDYKDKPIAHPAISGQSYQKIVGDVDVCIHYIVDEAGNRTFECLPTPMAEAGDRTGSLAKHENPDLLGLYNKIMGISDTVK